MFSILKKEINTFFASPVGYLVIAVFLLLNGLFLWLFKGSYNILDNGFADLSAFFELAPWILIFLVPAVTMRSFSDEKRQGTLELLLTKPISHLQVVLGKYLGAFTLILLAIIPTLLYVYTVYQLGNPQGNLDLGSTLGSYFGLLFLIGAYTAIGVFASTLSGNQIVAFIIAVFLCFFFFFGFAGLADVTSNHFIEQLGMNAHYNSMGRGVIDTRDIIYFASVAVFFVLLTSRLIGTERLSKQAFLKFLTVPVVLILLNIFGNSIYKRFDLTEDKRYTLSEATKTIIGKVESPVTIDVFLESEDFPSELRRLHTETRQLLEEFSVENSNIHFNFIDPLEDEATRDQNMQSLSQRGLTPMQLSVKESGKASNKVIFPWALASYNDKTSSIQLIKNNLGATQQELVTHSVQHLEFAFAEGLKKLAVPKDKNIAILKGNGQLDDIYIADFLKTLGEHYNIAPFTLDSVAQHAQGVSQQLKNFELIISAKPTEAFTEEEKFVLDQYSMQGGKSLWLVDGVAVHRDSLHTTGKTYAFHNDLNLTDFFFKYGVRMNPVLVNDLYSAPITLATGEGNQTQFNQFPWLYYPLVNTTSEHPIVNNINAVKLSYASQVDTLKNGIDKTVLLKSSPLSKLDGTPKEINLEMTGQKPDPDEYTNGNQPLAVLLEGKFTSVYNNRIKPVELSETKNRSKVTKMVVVASGDVIKNEVGRDGPLELGFDRGSGQTYGNKEFLLNVVNYLLDDHGLINIRNKEVAVAFLDHEKTAGEKTRWQVLNTAAPLILLAVFGLGFLYFRKRRYAGQ